ncbi:hypothetical protein ABZX93_32735 [Streptomyces sp. NPDC006632]|uniref:hypothetical protein n=1 Tax=Streptomyces sp. NPDC006632 TaxID=3157182 RepID=UPI0033A7F434
MAVVPETKNGWFTVTATHLKFWGEGSVGDYAFELELYSEIAPDLSNQSRRGETFGLSLRKTADEWLPHLVKGERPAFLISDLRTWVDEDEDEGDQFEPIAQEPAENSSGSAGSTDDTNFEMFGGTAPKAG